VGKVAKGEGVLSLARGFSMAGIPSTITKLWSVEDQTTYSLTELFYTYLNEGLSKDEAL
jgi:CHAT domain-containing protein